MVNKIENQNGKIICEGFDVAETILSQITGLMFNFNKNKKILFKFKDEKEHPIHSFFVFHDFFAIYLNSKKEVLEIHKVSPFKAYISNKADAKYLLEAYSFENNPKIGDRLKWTS